MLQTIIKINESINGVVWGTFGISLLLIAGIIMTLANKGFQFAHVRHWFKHTIGAIFKDKNTTAHTKKEDKSISQFQSLCTALAATIGTGNIVGVASAIISGGPGAVFWMWVMAIFGMMTNYSENVLGIFYRRKNSKGEWCGGAMYYLKDGLGAKKGFKTIGAVLAVLFSCFCLLASFGIGNMSQVNSISGNMKSAFHIPTYVTGIAIMILSAFVILGGLKRVASVTEKLVPVMAVLYIVGALAICIGNYDKIVPAFGSIFRGAFNLQSAGGGVIGYGISRAITYGFKRGAFSNEAGLGSSVMVHSNSNVKEPVKQGMWGIFEVFADTIVVCTLTALCVLTSGLVDLDTGKMLTQTPDSGLVGEAFGKLFGPIGPMFIAIAILLFAYSTVLGWSHYGSKSFEYLFGEKKIKISKNVSIEKIRIYQFVFIVMTFVGCTMNLKFAWDLSDTFNGLMMIPNLIGVLALSGTVAKITANYSRRTFKGSTEKPMLSAFSKEHQPK